MEDKPNGVAVSLYNQPPIQPGHLNQDQVALLKTTIAKGATDDELELFLQVCKLRSLDPFSKQIYLVKRWNSDSGREEATFQVGIDGFLAIAERTGKYAGQEGPWWCGSDGAWTDVWLHNSPPRAAKVGILRKDFAKPLYAVAHYDELVQTKKDGKPTRFWSRMPANQLAKCAQVAGLRRAFPEELGHFYIPEEMPDEETETGAASDATPQSVYGDIPTVPEPGQSTTVVVEPERPKSDVETERPKSDVEPEAPQVYLKRVALEIATKLQQTGMDSATAAAAVKNYWRGYFGGTVPKDPSLYIPAAQYLESACQTEKGVNALASDPKGCGEKAAKAKSKPEQRRVPISFLTEELAKRRNITVDEAIEHLVKTGLTSDAEKEAYLILAWYTQSARLTVRHKPSMVLPKVESRFQLLPLNPDIAADVETYIISNFS